VSGRSDLVHYVSPFDAPKMVPRWLAETFLEADERRWSRLAGLDMVNRTQRAVGPPHIESAETRGSPRLRGFTALAKP
jgi:hypothetical protein